MNQAIFFSAAIIIAGFVPLFTLSGVEGHIFGPMAKTYAYAIAGGLIATFTVSPALCALLLPDRSAETETLVVRCLRRVYRAGRRASRWPTASLTLGGAGAAAGARRLGGAHRSGWSSCRKLEEGNFWIRATMPPSISLEAGNGYVNRMRADHQELSRRSMTVVSQHGRPDDGTDATGFFNAEFFVPLKPFDTWPHGVDKEKLTDADERRSWTRQFPGVDFNFSQYIEDNVEEAASGVKGENSVKLFGSDLETLEKTAEQDQGRDEHGARHHRPGRLRLAGPADGAASTSTAPAAARYGLAPGDINTTVQAAIGGQAAGNLYEDGSDRNFPIMVRLAPEYRQSLDAIRRITDRRAESRTATASSRSR